MQPWAALKPAGLLHRTLLPGKPLKNGSDDYLYDYLLIDFEAKQSSKRTV